MRLEPPFQPPNLLVSPHYIFGQCSPLSPGLLNRSDQLPLGGSQTLEELSKIGHFNGMAFKLAHQPLHGRPVLLENPLD